MLFYGTSESFIIQTDRRSHRRFNYIIKPIKLCFQMKQCQFVEEGWGVWFCAFKKQISSKPFAFQICHQWNWCWPCKVLLFCATSCEVVIYDSIWCPLYCQQQLTQSSFFLFGRLLLLEMRQLQTHHWIDQEAVSVASFENTFSCVQLQPNWCVACHLKVYNSLV